MIISNKSLVLRTGLFAACLGLFIAGCTNPDDAPSTTKPDAGSAGTDATKPAALTFASIEPTVKARCAQCHTGPQAKNGYDFSSYESFMKGGKDGPPVKPNDPDNSLLVQVITGAPGHPKMPPIGDPLTADEIKAVKDWIAAGATG
jgi:hypothetical protein